MDNEFIYNTKCLSRLNQYKIDYGSRTRFYDLGIDVSYTYYIDSR